MYTSQIPNCTLTVYVCASNIFMYFVFQEPVKTKFRRYYFTSHQIKLNIVTHFDNVKFLDELQGEISLGPDKRRTLLQFTPIVKNAYIRRSHVCILNIMDVVLQWDTWEKYSSVVRFK